MITHEIPSILQVSWVDQMMPKSQMSSQDNTLLWVIIGLLTLIIAYLWYNGRERVLTEPIPGESPRARTRRQAIHVLRQVCYQDSQWFLIQAENPQTKLWIHLISLTAT